jgi:branched-chain amino acid transport system ATP-binding protein
MSDGELQMRPICHALLGNLRGIVIDDPTKGLAPKIVAMVGEVTQDTRRRGVSVVLVAQKLAVALTVSQRVSVMGHGRNGFEGTPEQLTSDKHLLSNWLAA